MIGEKLHVIRKIAVLKAGGIGDLIAILAALWAIKKAYPLAEVVLFCREYHRELLEGRKSPVDRFVVVPTYSGVRDGEENPQELEKFFQDMQDEHFDLAIQMHGGGKYSNHFVKRLGARLTLGYKTPDAIELDMWMPFIYRQNEVFRALELVAMIGARTDNLLPWLDVMERDRQEVKEKLPGLRGPYVVIHPGAGAVTRRWPPERFARLADTLNSEGYQIVVTGTWVEQDNVEQMIRSMRAVPHVAMNLLSMGGMVGLMSGASLVVSNDSGPMHLADAVGARTLGIMWCGNAIGWSHLNRRTYRVIISWMVDCPLCGADMTGEVQVENGCDHNACFVERASFEDVLYNARQLLMGH
jgi:ADP-heptose:LPS heptosyltransferase